jgi:hypothetical protein
MHANRDSIMKPAAAVRRYAGRPKGQCQNRQPVTLRCWLGSRRRALHVLFIKLRFMLPS